MMDPYRGAFTAEVRKVRLNPPQIPFLSSQQVPGSPQNRQPIHPIGLDTCENRSICGWWSGENTGPGVVGEPW